MTTSRELSTEQIPATLFSREQWEQLQSLLARLDERQSLWLSGYLAAQQSQAPEKNVAPTEDAARIWIAYGSETGNCELLASRLGNQLDQQRIPYTLVSLAEVKPRALLRVNYLLVICSTHGDGDPPETCTTFFEGLLSAQALKLVDTQFAVLALGDSSYEHFCTAGKQIDERLAQLGAKRLCERIDCDVDFEEPAEAWMANIVQRLPRLQTTRNRTLTVVSGEPAKASASGRQSTVPAEVLENICLSNTGRAHPIHHIELLVEPGALQLLPGDAVGIYPQNPPDLVNAVLDMSGFSGDEPVKIQQRAMPVVEALRESVDLRIAGVPFINCWAKASNSHELQQLCQEDRKTQQQFLRSVHIIDVLRSHPGTTDAQTFVDSLRPLQPRLYDVANEITPDTDEVHLTVKNFQFSFNDRKLAGIASQYLLELQPGEELRFYPHYNKRFRLPEDDEAPLILLANGTGIAPFRAFLQHMVRYKKKRATWLIFQEQRREEDFLYQLDVQQAAKQGVLQHIDTLFTGDQPGVQLTDLLGQHDQRLLNWISRGAHLYICGEKNVLGHCEEMFKHLCERAGGVDVWLQLVNDKRLHRNLY